MRAVARRPAGRRLFFRAVAPPRRAYRRTLK
jgi:hypothetical protein